MSDDRAHAFRAFTDVYPNLATEHIARHFQYSHLPAELQIISCKFAALAEIICDNTPRCAERSVALRHLLESKDAAVRAANEALLDAELKAE